MTDQNRDPDATPADDDLPRPARWRSGNGRFEIVRNGSVVVATEVVEGGYRDGINVRTLPEAMAWCAARAAGGAR